MFTQRNSGMNSTTPTNHLSSFGQDYKSHHQSAAMASGLASSHFSSHYSHAQTAPLYPSSTGAAGFHSQSFEQNQFSSLNRYQNHGLHSNSFSPSPFHLNLPKSNFEHSIGNPLNSGPLGSGTLNGHSVMPNDSCNSSASSSSPNSSSSSSSSPDSKFNFLNAQQSNYLSNYLNSNSAFSSQSSLQSSIQHQLQSNNNPNSMHHLPTLQHSYSPFANQSLDNKFVNSLNNQFNNSVVPLFEDDDLRDRDEDDDETSMSHFDMKTAMIHYSNGGNEPLPGKTRTREKYRSVYSELQRHELENEFLNSKYITIKRKTELAHKLSLSERQIKIWFQNRRAKQRRTEDRRVPLKKPMDQFYPC